MSPARGSPRAPSPCPRRAPPTPRAAGCCCCCSLAPPRRRHRPAPPRGGRTLPRAPAPGPGLPHPHRLAPCPRPPTPGASASASSSPAARGAAARVRPRPHPAAGRASPPPRAPRPKAAQPRRRHRQGRVACLAEGQLERLRLWQCTAEHAPPLPPCWWWRWPLAAQLRRWHGAWLGPSLWIEAAAPPRNPKAASEILPYFLPVP
jgi:hypothetical protein